MMVGGSRSDFFPGRKNFPVLVKSFKKEMKLTNNMFVGLARRWTYQLVW